MVSDYYAMLGIEPTADRSAIEAALARWQPAWSAGTRNPKTKHTYQSYLDQIPALRRALLGEPSARLAYDAERAATRRAERDRLMDELQRLVRLRAAKGGLTVTDRELLRQEALRLGIGEDDFRQLIEPIPPRPETPPEADPPDPPLDVIEPAVRRQIRLALEHLRRRDLYHVLDLHRDAPTSEIAARADAERRKWMQRTQVTAEKTAWLEAISYAQSHLVAADSRARYDRTLAIEAEESFGEVLAFGLKGLRQLDPGTRRALLDESARLGVEPNRAERLLRRSCRALGVIDAQQRPEAPPGGEPPRFLRCLSCSGITAVEAATRRLGPLDCRHCGASLRWDCPVCRRTHLADDRRCACGFPLEHLEPLQHHFDAAQNAFRSRDYAGALTWLDRVVELAPKHAAARRAAEKVRQRITDIDRLRASYETERARRSMVAASKIVQEWARLAEASEPDLVEARAVVRQALAESATLTARADDQVRTNPGAARTLYIKALGLVRDDPSAAEGLRRCPPDPPGDLRAITDTGRVRLRWSAPPPDGLGKVTYRVIRRRGGVPGHIGDGLPVGDFAGIECEDTAPTPGEVVGYGVFAIRGETASIRGATAGPLLVLADVEDLRVEARSREVRLTWTSPPGIIGVRVVRKEGTPPSGPQDGTRVDATGDRAVDSGVSDAKLYHYAVYALFEDADGGVVASRGVVVSALPHQPGEDVDSLHIARDREGLRLSWPGRTRGEVAVVRTPRPLPFPAGAHLGRIQAAAIEGRWLAPSGNNHVSDPDPPPSGVCYYTPLTAWGEMMTVGRPAAYSCVPDPTDLRATRREAGRYHLRWRWMHEGGGCVVVARRGSFPSAPDDSEALRFPVTEAEYSRLGYAAINLPAGAAGPWHVAVYGTLSVGSSVVHSQGVEPSSRIVLSGPSREITVTYALRPPRLRGRSWSLTFHTEPPEQPIPATTLVGHTRTLPLSAEDGDIIEELPPAHDGQTFHIRTNRNLSRYRLRVFVDPRSDPNLLSPIKLRHPDPGGTRV
jgi:hypothetical protein